MADRIHTTRELIAALEAFIATNPEQADQPVEFSINSLPVLNRGEGVLYYVRDVVASPDTGSALLINTVSPEN